MALEVEYFQSRFGATCVPLPQFPVIPLGIHAHDFTRTDRGCAAMRRRFGAPDDAVVIMTMGRFTSVEKANPAPMFIALEQVAKATAQPVHLWMVGWASRPEEEDLHRKGASALCPSVTCQMIDGRDADVRRDIWSGADIFTLPVDNIQETFGLVPVEAMAAGLPVVMPDWNGFRDTVVHGETGYLIPTLMPAAGSGPRIAQRFADGTDDYLRYLAIVQQQTVIDIPAYRDAFLALIADPEKRRAMGAAGRRHVLATFDWQAVMPQYLALADELADMRRGAVPCSPRLASGAISPIEVDPFRLYQSYPSATPSPYSIAVHKQALTLASLDALDQVNGRAMYGRKIVPDDTLLTVSNAVAVHTGGTVAQIAAATGLSIGITLSSLLFLAKFDFVALQITKPN